MAKNPDNLDAYLSIVYLLMNLLVEEDHNEKNHSYYVMLCKHYFQESYRKFNHNSEYLYYMDHVLCMSPWYCGIEDYELHNQMIEQAIACNPNDLVYKWYYFYDISQSNPHDKNLNIYIDLVLDANGVIQKTLIPKGSLGEHVLDMIHTWAIRIKTNR